MTPERFLAVTTRYQDLRIAVVGDFCLDRYLEIDPTRSETSIETGLPVHNVARVRSLPGAAGTILNNLVALGLREVVAIGFCGEDGEGYELRRELASLPGVNLDHFCSTPVRSTFTYIKPLVLEAGRLPVELSRLDVKNWTPTPSALAIKLAGSLREVARRVDAVVVMDQVDVPETGVVTSEMLGIIAEISAENPSLPVIADSRRGLRGWPPVHMKMNGEELASVLGQRMAGTTAEVGSAAGDLASIHGRPVFVTLSERGMVVAIPGGVFQHVAALPIRGPIDIVGAGDSVTANLAAALAGGATPSEAARLAIAAASVVIHQLGTTGTARVSQLAHLFGIPSRPARPN